MSPIAAAALELVGSRFRLHGRDPATGLDCVGVVAVATGASAPTGYALRGSRSADIARNLEAQGWVRASSAEPGDVLLMRTGPAQLHLGVKTERGVVHADAGLRRVVERPGAPDWEVVEIWRRLF